MSDSDLDPEAPAALGASGERMDADDRLRPEFVRAVVERVEAGDDEGARALVEPLHPADLADLFELVDSDDRRALAAAIADMLDGDVLAEMNEHVREELVDTLDPRQVADIAGEMETDDAVAMIEDLEEDEHAPPPRLDPDYRARDGVVSRLILRIGGRLMQARPDPVPVIGRRHYRYLRAATTLTTASGSFVVDELHHPSAPAS